MKTPLLVKILAALAVCVATASVLTSLFETRLTRSTIDRESRRLAMSHLAILTQAYLAEDRTLDDAVRDIAASMTARGLPAMSDSGEIDRWVTRGRDNSDLDLHLVDVINDEGRSVVGRANGVRLRDSSAKAAALDASDGVSRVLPTTDHTHARTVMTRVGLAADGLILAGGIRFGDPYAHQLRARLGDLFVGQVVLVADGEVAGSTLRDRPELPPGTSEDGSPLPLSPTVVE